MNLRSTISRFGRWFGTALIMMLVVRAENGYGQLIGQFTQYYANELAFNPAYAGANDALALTAAYRSQWSGLEGAPSTETFSLHSLVKNDHVGLGLNITNDKIGIHRNLTAMSSYSYRINVSNTSYFAFGVQFGFNSRRSHYESLSPQVYDPNDPSLASDISLVKFEFGSGLYFKSARFRAGLSAPKMWTTRAHLNDSVSLELNRAQYFLFARYQLALSTGIDLYPGMLIKYQHGIPLSMDLNVCTEIKKVLLVGLSYRPAESVGTLLQINLTPQLKAGYAHDFVVAPAANLAPSSHEIMLNYVFTFTTFNVPNVR